MSFDMTNLPLDVQAYIQQEIAKALKANEPAPPRELTPGEKALTALRAARLYERADRSIPSSSGDVHHALMRVLDELVAAVFPDATLEEVASGAHGAASEPGITTVV